MQKPFEGPGTPAFVFDLDGTLVDSVYQHVLAWRDALERANLPLAVWMIHRRIGMSGGLMVNALAREIGHTLTAQEGERIQKLHAEVFSNIDRRCVRCLVRANCWRTSLRRVFATRLPQAGGSRAPGRR